MGILRQFLSWKAEVPFKNPKEDCAIEDGPKVGVGLQTLIHLEPKRHGPNPSIVHRYSNISTVRSREQHSLPPPSSSSSMFERCCVMGDLIGTESGDYMNMSSNVEELKESEESYCNRRYRRSRRSGKREFPPPISLLRDESGNNMPLVFKRETSSEGRLIIRAERVKREPYLIAHRENGRLRLFMNPLRLPLQDDVDDNALDCHDCGYPITHNEDEQEELGDDDDDYDDDFDFNQEQVIDDVSECESKEEEELGSEDGSLQKKWAMKEEGERNCLGFWKGKNVEGPNGYLGRPGSSPLPPMTTVSVM